MGIPNRIGPPKGVGQNTGAAVKGANASGNWLDRTGQGLSSFGGNVRNNPGTAAAVIGAGAGVTYEALKDQGSNGTTATRPLDSTAEFGKSDSSAGDVAEKLKASMQHLEAPINGAINQWLEEYSPNISALFKMTGLEPLQLVNEVVKRFHRWGVTPSASNVHAAMLDVVDSADERAAIRTADQLIDTNLAEDETVLSHEDPRLQRTFVAIAEIESAARLLPGGIQDLIRLRAALQLKPSVFNSAVQLRWGFHPEVVLGDEVQDASERLMIRS